MTDPYRTPAAKPKVRTRWWKGLEEIFHRPSHFDVVSILAVAVGLLILGAQILVFLGRMFGLLFFGPLLAVSVLICLVHIIRRVRVLGREED